MRLSLTPWMLPGLLGVAAIACLAAALAWRRRSRSGARELLFLSAGVGWWCLLQGVVISLPTLEAKVFASKLQYLGIASVPLTWLWFAAAYTGRTGRISPLGWALLAAPEAATLLLAWTNQWHGLVWEHVALIPADGFSALHIRYGAWFQLHVYYAYGLVLLGTCALVASLVQSRYHYDRAAAVVVAAMCPVAANLAYLLGFASPRWVDLTPSGFALGGLVVTWSLLRVDLLDLPPVARSRVLDAMNDGVLVLDAGGRVLDMNPAAAQLLRCRIGDTLPALLSGPAAAVPAGEPAPGMGPREVATLGDRVLEISRSTTRDVPGGGTIMILRDVTERDRLQRELQELGEELLRINEDLSRLASTDELTGLANRRQFFRVLEQELRRAVRYDHPLSLLLLDVDHFKRINDSLGHGAGDMVLRGVGETIRWSVRDVDMVGRLGGDELAVVLPETDVEGAERTARRILEKISGRSYRTPDGAEVGVTVSIGLVVAPPGKVDMEGLVHDADVALYEAKAAGRNQMRIVTARG